MFNKYSKTTAFRTHGRLHAESRKMKKDAVLDTLIPLPSYLFSPRARLLLGLHVSGSLFKICGEFLNRHYGHTALESIINCQTFLAVITERLQ